MFNTGHQHAQDQLDSCSLSELQKNRERVKLLLPPASPRHKELFKEGWGRYRHPKFIKSLKKTVDFSKVLFGAFNRAIVRYMK